MWVIRPRSPDTPGRFTLPATWLAALGRDWPDRNGRQDDVYNKFFAANVPWMFDREVYEPEWTPDEVAQLRTTLTDAANPCAQRFHPSTVVDLAVLAVSRFARRVLLVDLGHLRRGKA